MFQRIGTLSLLVILVCLRLEASAQVSGPCSKVCAKYTGVFSTASKAKSCCPSIRTICSTVTSQPVAPVTITVTTTTTDESSGVNSQDGYTVTTTETEITSNFLTTTEMSTTTEVATATDPTTSDETLTTTQVETATDTATVTGTTTEADTPTSTPDESTTSSVKPPAPTSPPNTPEYWNEYFAFEGDSTDDITQFYLAASIRGSVSWDDSQPPGSVLEITGGNNDVNKGFGGRYSHVIADQAVVGNTAADLAIQVGIYISDGVSNPQLNHQDGQDLAKGAGGQDRFLQYQSGPASDKKYIDKMLLWRTAQPETSPPGSWSGISGDLNAGRGGDSLYILYHLRTYTGA